MKQENQFFGGVCPFCCEDVVSGRCLVCRRPLPDPKLEFFSTPASVVRALLQREKFRGLTWEPACGHGSIAKMIPGEVMASDLADYGYGESGVDFLTTWRDVDNVVTNPPFKLKVEFKRRALECARGKVAMLLPVGTLGYEIDSGSPLKAIYVFRSKVHFVNASWKMAWYVWERGYSGPTIRFEWVEPVFPKRMAS